eukprot:1654320-Amphidinium_carterae.1
MLCEYFGGGKCIAICGPDKARSKPWNRPSCDYNCDGFRSQCYICPMPTGPVRGQLRISSLLEIPLSHGLLAQ